MWYSMSGIPWVLVCFGNGDRWALYLGYVAIWSWRLLVQVADLYWYLGGWVDLSFPPRHVWFETDLLASARETNFLWHQITGYIPPSWRSDQSRSSLVWLVWLLYNLNFSDSFLKRNIEFLVSSTEKFLLCQFLGKINRKRKETGEWRQERWRWR